jgi:DNA polymerase III delta subunit
MIQFFYGDNLSKLSDSISNYAKKNNLQKINYELSSENIPDILGALDTPNLFGESNLFIVDVTDCEFEDIEKFSKGFKDYFELIIVNEGSIDARGKSYKLLSKFRPQEFVAAAKTSNIFLFTDYLFAKDLKKTYQELENLQQSGEEDLMIFNMIVSTLRSIIGIKFDTKQKSKIPPFKIRQMTASADKFSEEDIRKLYKILSENDLKFKTGELTSEMLLLHSINSILKDGSSK